MSPFQFAIMKVEGREIFLTPEKKKNLILRFYQSPISVDYINVLIMIKPCLSKNRLNRIKYGSNCTKLDKSFERTRRAHQEEQILKRKVWGVEGVVVERVAPLESTKRVSCK